MIWWLLLGVYLGIGVWLTYENRRVLYWWIIPVAPVLWLPYIACIVAEQARRRRQ